MFINSLSEKSIKPFQLYFKFHLMSLKNDFINVFPLASSLPNNLIPHNPSGTYKACDRSIQSVLNQPHGSVSPSSTGRGKLLKKSQMHFIVIATKS